ncbi:hypothetical protein ABGT15_13000 [Flavobacterium enshiense]|uniref:hypothetical protein n=1 Tax=Flavobacterium enshiense TaxID=1341165 RepID=UPI00345C6CD7
MSRKTKLFIFITISVLIIFFLNYKIRTDISYHAGKDGGYFKRLESVIILSVLFYITISKKMRALYGLIGFVISILSSFLGLLISSVLPANLFGDTIMHLIVFGISYSSFFGIEKIIEKGCS